MEVGALVLVEAVLLAAALAMVVGRALTAAAGGITRAWLRFRAHMCRAPSRS